MEAINMLFKQRKIKLTKNEVAANQIEVLFND